MKLTPEHRQLADTVTRFCEREINPFVAEWEKAQEFPSHEVFKKLGDLGLLGLKYPEEFGGAGLDFSYSAVMAEACRPTWPRQRWRVSAATNCGASS